MFRIGQGYDIHRLAEGRKFILGGYEIPTKDNIGLNGHSDADALIHAVIDALLGALALGDIGQMFPDTDEQWRGADSRQLLRFVLARPEFIGWRIVNLDTSVIAQAPKLAPHIVAIRQSLANILGCPLDCVSVKAKTNERLDAVGRKEAVAVQAVILLEK